MNLDVVFWKCNEKEDYARLVVQLKVFEQLKNSFPFTLRAVNPKNLDIPEYKGSSTSIDSIQNMTFVNPENNKAIIFNIGPRLEPSVLPAHGFDHLDIVQIIGGSGLSKEFYDQVDISIKDKIDYLRTPLTFPLDKISHEKVALSFTENRSEDKIKQAIFIGNTTNLNGRAKLAEILNKHPYFKIIHSIRESGLPFPEYLKEISKYRLTVSLNGFAEICYRDWEAMSVSMPIIRSELYSKYNPELVPNVHYFSASDHAVDGMIRYKKSYSEIADQFIDKVESIIDDLETQSEIGRNGRYYFENNVTTEGIVRNFFDTVNFNLLFE